MSRATSRGWSTVRLRVMVVKSANGPSAPPCVPPGRHRGAARRRARWRRSTSAATTSGSSTSTGKVSSLPMLRPARRARRDARLGPRRGPPGAGRTPRRALGGGWPQVCGRCRRRCAGRAGATAPRSAPRPPQRPTGSGCRNATTSATGTTSSPSGLAPGGCGRNELGARHAHRGHWAPARRGCARGSARRSGPVGPACAPPGTSRNASSRAGGSTNSVIDRKTSMIPALARA